MCGLLQVFFIYEKIYFLEKKRSHIPDTDDISFGLMLENIIIMLYQHIIYTVFKEDNIVNICGY